jgi:hypothetical protein
VRLSLSLVRFARCGSGIRRSLSGLWSFPLGREAYLGPPSGGRFCCQGAGLSSPLLTIIPQVGRSVKVSYKIRQYISDIPPVGVRDSLTPTGGGNRALSRAFSGGCSPIFYNDNDDYAQSLERACSGRPFAGRFLDRRIFIGERRRAPEAQTGTGGGSGYQRPHGWGLTISE